MKVNNYFGIFYAVVSFWHQKFSSRNNDNPIVNEGIIEDLVEMHCI